MTVSASGNAVIDSGSDMSTDVSSTILVAVGGSGAPWRAWSARRSVKSALLGGGGRGSVPGLRRHGGVREPAGSPPLSEPHRARWVGDGRDGDEEHPDVIGV
jgi:hypothetical protein